MKKIIVKASLMVLLNISLVMIWWAVLFMFWAGYMDWATPLISTLVCLIPIAATIIFIYLFKQLARL